MKSIFAIVILLSAVAFGQTATPAPNDNTHIDLSEAYSLTTSTPDVGVSKTAAQATVTRLRVPITGNLSIWGGAYLIPTQDSRIFLAGPEYAWKLSNILTSKNLRFDATKFDVFAYAGLGGKQQDKVNVAALSGILGTGIRYHLSKNLVIEPVNLSFLRAGFGKTGTNIVLNNHMSFSSLVGVQF